MDNQEATTFELVLRPVIIFSVQGEVIGVPQRWCCLVLAGGSPVPDFLMPSARLGEQPLDQPKTVSDTIWSRPF